MIITIDTETQGLNPNAFLLGSICHENGKVEGFSDSAVMYDRILELKEKQAVKGKRLLVYAHNLSYDYIALRAHLDPHNHEYSSEPFLANRWEMRDGKLVNTMKWYCTTGLYRGSLEEIGKMTGNAKQPMPRWLMLDAYTPTVAELLQAQTYCHHDTTILMLFLKRLKKQLEDEGLNVPYLITTSQISMTGLLRHLREREVPREKGGNTGKYWFEDIRKGQFYQTRYRHLIHAAFHGSRNEAFQHGRFPAAMLIDINSLYPHVAIIGEYPDLSTERFVVSPNLTYALRQEGVLRCVVLTPQKDILPFLPIRTDIEGKNPYTAYLGNMPDGSRRILIGSWTIPELRIATELGYTIIHTSHAVFYNLGKNPFTEHFTEIYARRQRARNAFENYFYKLMMNGAIGKLATQRSRYGYRYCTTEELPELTRAGWMPIRYHDGKTISVIRDEGFDRKRYYAPIWAAYVYAYARTALYNALRCFPREHLYYCDTDSIIAQRGSCGFERIKYSKEHGDWKVERTGEDLLIYGRKAYRIGDAIRVNRVPRRAITKAAFDDGQLYYEDLTSIFVDRENAGKRIPHVRTLTDQQTLETAHEKTPKRIVIDSALTVTDAELRAAQEAINGGTQWA